MVIQQTDSPSQSLFICIPKQILFSIHYKYPPSCFHSVHLTCDLPLSKTARFITVVGSSKQAVKIKHVERKRLVWLKSVKPRKAAVIVPESPSDSTLASMLMARIQTSRKVVATMAVVLHTGSSEVALIMPFTHIMWVKSLRWRKRRCSRRRAS